MAKEQLLLVYKQHIKNLKLADDTGLHEDLVLVTRDSIADENWTLEQQAQITELDNQLVTHWKLLAQVLPDPNFRSDRQRWWWFLDEGPQVREEAKALGRAG